MAGGKQRPSNKSKPRRPNTSSSISLFVEGGILDDIRTPPFIRGKRSNPNSMSGSRTKSSDRANASNSNSEMKKQVGNAFRYVYPSSDLQGNFPSEFDIQGKNADDPSEGSKPFISSDSKECNVMVYEENSPPSGDIRVEYNYDYSSGFVLGESSHHGLGFSGEADATNDVIQQSGELKDESSHRGLGFPGKPELMFGETVLSSKNVHNWRITLFRCPMRKKQMMVRRT